MLISGIFIIAGRRALTMKAMPITMTRTLRLNIAMDQESCAMHNPRWSWTERGKAKGRKKEREAI